MKLLYSFKCLLLSVLLITQTMPVTSYAQTASDPECAGMYSDNPLYLDNCNRCKKRLDMVWDPNQKMCTKNQSVQSSQNNSNACFDGRGKKDELQCLMGVASENVEKIDMSLGGYIDEGSGFWCSLNRLKNSLFRCFVLFLISISFFICSCSCFTASFRSVLLFGKNSLNYLGII